MLAGAAAMLGHWRPLFLRFTKGGKMVATAGGAFLGVAPLVGLVGLGVWIVVFVATALRVGRVDGHGGVAAAVVLAVRLPVAGDRVRRALPPSCVILLHRANINRLLPRRGAPLRAVAALVAEADG